MKVVLKDGTEISDTIVGKTMNFLELSMNKEKAIANLAKFMDPEIMSEIEYYSGAWKVIYTGFSQFVKMDNRENEILVWMGGNENSTVSDQIPLFDEMYMPKGE